MRTGRCDLRSIDERLASAHGELERLIEAETRYSEGRSYARAEVLGYAHSYREHYPVPFTHDDDYAEHNYYGHGRRRHRERGGFLEDIFGGDD